MSYKSAVCAAGASLLAASPSFAQGAEGYGAEIVVTGRGLPDTPATPAYDVKVIDREEIISTGSGRIEDALSNIAGFSQFRRSDSRSANPSAQGATLRALGGNATSRALVLLDGVPMMDPFFGYIPYSAIAPDRIGSIRVTRGGGNGAFGAGAVAGTIEMESAGPEDTGMVSGSLLVNDRGETESAATLTPKFGGGFAQLSGRWDRGKGFYTTPRSQRVPGVTSRAKYENWSVSGRVVQPLGDEVELQARALIFDDNRTLRFKGADNSMEGQDVSVRLVGRGDWKFDVLAYGQWRDFSNIVISSTRFVPVLDQHDTPSSGLGGKAEIRPPLGDDHVLRIGADYRRSRGHMEETAISAFSGNVTAERRAGGTNSDLGLYIEDDWTLGRVVLTAGARADRYAIRRGYYYEEDGAGVVQPSTTSFARRSGWKGSFRGGILGHVNDQVTLRAAAYTGIRLPTLNELYRGFVVFPVTTSANAALRPERLRGFEAGVEVAPSEKITFSLTAFDNKLKNAIANVTLPAGVALANGGTSNAGDRERRNVDAIHAKGVELGADFDLGKVGFSGSLAYTDAKVKSSGTAIVIGGEVVDIDGKRPSQTPKWSASGTLNYRPRDNWLFAVTLRHVGQQYEDDLERNSMKSATTLDAFAQVGIVDRLSFVLRGENLFDETIITRRQPVTGAPDSLDYGAPRTVWAGFRYGY